MDLGLRVLSYLISGVWSTDCLDGSAITTSAPGSCCRSGSSQALPSGRT